MNDDGEQLERFIELLEELVVSMQSRIEKLEQQQEDALTRAPFHLSVPMREFAERKSVGFHWQPDILRPEPRA